MGKKSKTLQKYLKKQWGKKISFMLKKIMLIAGAIALFSQCSGRFVKREQLADINRELAGVHVTTADIDIGNGATMPPGRKLCLYAESDKESIKVYGYPYTQYREEAIGNNILYMFDEDFPEEEFVYDIFTQKLYSRVQKDDKLTDYCIPEPVSK